MALDLPAPFIGIYCTKCLWWCGGSWSTCGGSWSTLGGSWSTTWWLLIFFWWLLIYWFSSFCSFGDFCCFMWWLLIYLWWCRVAGNAGFMHFWDNLVALDLPMWWFLIHLFFPCGGSWSTYWQCGGSWSTFPVLVAAVWWFLIYLCGGSLSTSGGSWSTCDLPVFIFCVFGLGLEGLGWGKGRMAPPQWTLPFWGLILFFVFLLGGFVLL